VQSNAASQPASWKRRVSSAATAPSASTANNGGSMPPTLMRPISGITAKASAARIAAIGRARRSCINSRAEMPSHKMLSVSALWITGRPSRQGSDNASA